MALLLSSLPFTGTSQENTNLFVIVDYMKVKAGDDDAYLSVEQEICKPIHQERIKQGNIIGWILYGVRYTGANDEYNYVTAKLFDNVANLENPYEGIDFEKLHPGKSMGEASEKTLNSRKMVKSNLIRLVSSAYPENSIRPALYKYIEVNFMKTKPGSPYLNLARTMWQPIQQDFVNAGSRSGWSLWTSVFSRGFGEEFQFAAVNYYADFSKIGAANFNEAFDKAHPGKDVNEFYKKNREARLTVRSEFWEVLDVVMKE